MDKPEMIVDSPLGRRLVDREGAPVGVGRMDPRRSYQGVGELLRRYIAGSDRRSS